MPTEEEVDMLLRKFGSCLRPDPLPKDQRRCCFCNQQGDGRTDGPARLLNLDLDLWVSLLGWTGFCWVLLGWTHLCLHHHHQFQVPKMCD